MRTVHNSNPVWKLLFLLVFLFTACVTSLEPWAPMDALKPDPDLQGCWQDNEGDRWIFSKEDEILILTYTEDGLPARFHIHPFFLDSLAKKGDWRYFDLQPILSDNGNDLERTHLITSHGVMKYRFTPSGMVITMLDGENLEDYIKANDGPEYRTNEHRLLFEASSEDLWHFLKSIQHKDSLYSDVDTLTVCQ